MKMARALVYAQVIAMFLVFPVLKTDARPFLAATSVGGRVLYEIHQDSLKSAQFEDVFGPIPISGAPTNAVTIPLTGNYTAATPAASAAVPLSVKYVYQIMLDASQTLNLTVTNNSSADFSSVQVTLGALGSSTINSLAHSTSGVAQFNVGGKEMDSVVTITVTITPSASGTFAAGDNITASFSLNGLHATKVVVLDSLLKDYAKTFTNEYNLTDTVDVGYIDIAEGFFIYSITNYTNIDMLLSVTHRHVWRSDFCQGKKPPLTSVSDLVGLTYQDSLTASNCNIALREQLPANQTNQYSKHNISANRLFTEWNPVKQKSVTKVDCQVNIGVYGRRVTLSAGDSLSFMINTTSFHYMQMAGTVRQTFRRTSDTVKCAVPSSWSSANHLWDFFTSVRMPDSAAMDTLAVTQNFFSPIAPDSSCRESTKFTPITGYSFVRNQCDITKIINLKPDSIYFTQSLTIPVGSRIKLVNDLVNPIDPDFSKYMGRMRIYDSVSISIPSAPGAPITLYPVSGAVISGTTSPPPSIKLAWNSVSTAVSYSVQVSTTPDFSSMVKDTAGITDTFFVLTGLANSTKYYWCVNAANAGGTSGWSITAFFTLAVATLPDSVILVSPVDTAKNTSEGTLFIWRTATPSATRYMLQIATDSSMGHVLVQDSTINDTLFITASLTVNQTYWWRVKAQNALGWGPYGRKAEFICISAGVLTEHAAPISFECRGFSRTVRYSLSEQCRVSVTYYDVKGRPVFSYVNKLQGPGRYSLTFPGFALGHGAYLCVFEAGTFVKKEKVLVLR